MAETPYEPRLKALQHALTRKNLDAYIVLDRSNTFYLTGFTGTFSILLIGNRAAYFITDFRYIERVRAHLAGFTIVLSKRNHERTVARIARRKSWKRIGFEETITYGDLERLRNADRRLQLQCARGMIEALRIKKDQAELLSIRKAAATCDAVFARIRPLLRPGTAEKQIERKIRTTIERLGGQSEAFPTIVASGPNSSMPHYETGSRTLQKGDLVTIDLGVRLDGYCSDITRTFFIGSASREQRRIYEVVLEAQKRALEGIKPGVAATQADRLARSFIVQSGYGKFFGHGLGHGVGIDIHEPPYLRQEDKTLLYPGMVITIEPGIYIPGKMGVRIEDLAVVTDIGCEVLTLTPKDFSAAVLRI
jgi:Xaa-Pro aminopeptidase